MNFYIKINLRSNIVIINPNLIKRLQFKKDL